MWEQAHAPPFGLVHGLPVRVALVGEHPGYGPYPLVPRFVAVHSTGNKNPGANAEVHRVYFEGRARDRGVLVHYVVDDREAVQLADLRRTTYHAGDGVQGDGNRYSISLELCENADSDRERTLENGARLVALLLLFYNLPITAVRPHRSYSSTACPQLLPGPQWDLFVERVQRVHRELFEVGVPVGPARVLVKGPFLRAWLRNNGVVTYGWPSEPAQVVKRDGRLLLVQRFERQLLEHHPENPEPWNVIGPVVHPVR